MDIRTIAERIQAEGGRLYQVGGGVRDSRLGLAAKDQDYCVQGLTASMFAILFPEANLTGSAFPVFRLQVDAAIGEFALARTETKMGQGHTEFVAHASPDVSIEADLSRRDLTINAIAVDVLTNRVIDPFGGQADIHSGILRAVSPAFAEDPLRAYRTARFAAQLGFSIEPATLRSVAALKRELHTLAAERVWAELQKALQSAYPSEFFRVLKAADILDVHFPEIAQLAGVLQPAKVHPEGDALEHTLLTVQAAARLTDSAIIRFAALVHDVGKGTTPRHLWPSHPGHEVRGVPLVNQLCARLKTPAAWTRSARFATEQHMKIRQLRRMPADKVVDLLVAANRTPIGVHGFAIVGMADLAGRGSNSPVAQDATTAPLVDLWSFIQNNTKKPPTTVALNGRDYGAALRQARADAVERWRMQQQARSVE